MMGTKVRHCHSFSFKEGDLPFTSNLNLMNKRCLNSYHSAETKGKCHVSSKPVKTLLTSVDK